MASDYGDEAGEKLFDWMLRMGQDASQDAIRRAPRGSKAPSETLEARSMSP